MTIQEYNRQAVFEYARKWAYDRNPDYLDFENLGGDCTNFASQCIYAGSNVMNYTPQSGWYYNSSYDRTASWTGVEYLYNFLVSNNSYGPFAIETEISNLQIGDIVQLGRETGDFYHSPVVVGFYRGQILVAAHSNDAFNEPLSYYSYERIRGLHILGVRK
ncbi:MAG: amidase domain-containing protein [Christensenellaceae bacterium]